MLEESVLFCFAYLVIAYLVGAFPHMQILAKIAGIRNADDYHLSLWYGGKPLLAGIGVLGELVKGILPIIVGRILNLDSIVIAAAGLIVVAGQMWPVFNHFNGEKGNSIGAGMSAALAPVPFFYAVIPWILAVILKLLPQIARGRFAPQTRLFAVTLPHSCMPVGMLCGFLLMPMVSVLTGQPLVTTWALTALFILIIVRRVTVDIRNDVKLDKPLGHVFVNRLLLDRNYR